MAKHPAIHPQVLEELVEHEMLSHQTMYLKDDEVSYKVRKKSK